MIALFCAQKLRCGYIWDRHIDDARKAGLSDAQFDALRRVDIDATVWSDREKALLVFLDQVLGNPEVDSEVFDRMARLLVIRKLLRF